MPLKHSGGKKAFSENVRTEMHAGKPQRQALAIAYSTMRRAGHKMSDGGTCDVCGTACKYSGGGEVKGVHAEGEIGSYKLPKGQSTMGHSVRRGYDNYATHESKQNLKELKSMPNPKLKGLSGGGRINMHERGVHDPDPFGTGGGESSPGRWIREKQPEKMHQNEKEKRHSTNVNLAKHAHRDKLDTLKNMPNPKLKGLARGGKVYSIGPMKDERQPSKEALTAYEQGGDVEKYDDGGPVLDPDKTRDFVKGFTGHAEGGEIDADGDKDQDNDMLDMCADELLTAIHAKDPKLIIESLRAIIMSLKE